MERMSVNTFVNMVKEMRKAQKEFLKQNSVLIGLQPTQKVNLEKQVDKAISDREKRLFDEETEAQGSLF